MLLAEAFLHTLDPFLVQFSDGFGIRWYGLSYAAGFLLGWLMLRWLTAIRRTPLDGPAAGDLIFTCVVGVLVGGRVGYALFYQPSLFIGFSSSLPFWDLLAINKGGMASHGGMLGVILACWWYARSRQVPFRHVGDLMAFVAPIGLGLGRLANFVNAELWGRPLPASMQADPPWWSVKYPEELLREGYGRTVEAIQTLRPIVGGEDVLRQAVLAVRGGQESAIEAVRPLLTAYWPSQLFQALTDGPLLIGALVVVWWRPRKPGVVGGTFLLVYGILRIASERFRMPDEGVALLAGLSRGQVLSIAMVLGGAFVIWWSQRADVPRMGGLGPAGRPDQASDDS